MSENKFDFKMLPFLFFLAFILLSTHWFLYYSAVNFFAITSYTTKLVLFFSLAFLSISFIASAVLVRLYENFFTKNWYILSGFWIGVLVSLLIVLIFNWLFFLLLGNRFNINISWFLLLMAIVYSLYGSWNAFHPKIKEIEITIKDLPTEWQGKRIVQLSDVHLGVVHGADFMQKITDMTNSIDPDLVLITGDLFDGMDGALNSFIKPLSELKAKKGVFYVTGNHEFYLGFDEAFNILNKSNIKILNNEVVEVDGLQIIGAGYPKFGDSKDVSALIKVRDNFDKNKPTILMYHTPTSIGPDKNGDNASRSSTYWWPDIDTATARDMGIDLQLSGHTHKGQFFPFNLISKWIYKGRDYGLFQYGDFAIYITNGVGTWGPPIRTFNTPEIPVFVLR